MEKKKNINPNLFNITIIYANPVNGEARPLAVKWHNVEVYKPAAWRNAERNIRRRYPTVLHVNVYTVMREFKEQIKF